VELACRDHGYQLDQRESSRNSKVLRKDDEKLVVTRDRDGHDIYFSVGGSGDGGTVIDFVPQRRGGNLGEVRRDLRVLGDSFACTSGDRWIRGGDETGADFEGIWGAAGPVGGGSAL
jgi:hypothetical protein